MALDWEKILKSIKRSINEQVFETWFKPMKFISFEKDILKLGVPNSFFKKWIEKRYLAVIIENVESFLNKTVLIDLVVIEDFPSDDREAQERGAFVSPLEGVLNPRYTFDNFVVGPSNRFAHAASIAVAESPAKAYNPLFIYGGVGLGKTHLMQAIGHLIAYTRPTLKTTYITTEKFMNEMILSLQEKKIQNFREKYRNIDILLVDDVQFLSGKESTQEEFFHTFNTLYESNKQIVISCDRPPKDIPTLEERLISRFEWGLITDIQPPDIETRIAILKKKSELNNFEISSEIAYFIASKFTSNIRELEGALVKVIAFSKLNQLKNLSVDLVKEILKDIITGEKKEISVDLIQKIVAENFNLNPSDLKAKKRTANLVFPRQLAMYLSRELTDLSLPEIGKNFGGRDHSTIIHAYNSINKKIEKDKKTVEILNKLREKITNA
jgi:chromosomal replication initiator protein